jgi:hypothetical protein
MTVSLGGRDGRRDPGEQDTPMNITPTGRPSRRASGGLLASGRLNAGTPFETASTPVIALQPSANARG